MSSTNKYKLYSFELICFVVRGIDPQMTRLTRSTPGKSQNLQPPTHPPPHRHNFPLNNAGVLITPPPCIWPPPPPPHDVTWSGNVSSPSNNLNKINRWNSLTGTEICRNPQILIIYNLLWETERLMWFSQFWLRKIFARIDSWILATFLTLVHLRLYLGETSRLNHRFTNSLVCHLDLLSLFKTPKPVRSAKKQVELLVNIISSWVLKPYLSVAVYINKRIAWGS